VITAEVRFDYNIGVSREIVAASLRRAVNCPPGQQKKAYGVDWGRVQPRSAAICIVQIGSLKNIAIAGREAYSLIFFII
jgi:hypothetical protein